MSAQWLSPGRTGHRLESGINELTCEFSRGLVRRVDDPGPNGHGDRDGLKDVPITPFTAKLDILVDGVQQAGDELLHANSAVRFAMQRKFNVEGISGFCHRAVGKLHLDHATPALRRRKSDQHRKSPNQLNGIDPNR